MENQQKVGLVPEILPGTWQAHMNIERHNFLQPKFWEWVDFEDDTNEGIIHVIHSYLTYHGHSPKRIKEAGKGDIECSINGVKLSVIGIADEWRETVYRYDKDDHLQKDGSFRFVADSAESWFLFHEQFFGADSNDPDSIDNQIFDLYG